MKVSQLLVVVVVLALVAGCRGGLLRVPRVYNALISTNQRLAPSRADTVSLPVVAPLALPLLPAAAIVAEEVAPPPAGGNATEAEDLSPPAGNHTTAIVAPLAVYSPYYYPTYSYHYSPYLLPPPAPLLHYGYTYNYLPLPLAIAHPVAAKPEAKNDAKADADAGKDAASVEAN